MKKLESFVSLIGILVAQAFITILLFLACGFLSLFTNYVVGGSITFTLYALVWWFIWWVLYGENGIQQFYLKLIFATIPLIVFTAFYIWSHPTPNYTLMIPLRPEDIHFDFSTAVTGTILFPLYSVALQRYVLPRGRTWLRFVGVAIAMSIIGAVIFTSCYSFLPTQW